MKTKFQVLTYKIMLKALEPFLVMFHIQMGFKLVSEWTAGKISFVVPFSFPQHNNNELCKIFIFYKNNYVK